MHSHLENAFRKIGADVKIVDALKRRRFRRTTPPVSLDVIERRGEELFEIAIRGDADEVIDLSVLEVRKTDRHLVLMAKRFDRQGSLIEKDHFLCGFDERHLFVASVAAVSTVAAAKDSLKPIEIRGQEVGQDARKRNRRKTPVFKRQGEWFFVPEPIEINKASILRNEPLVRGGGGGKAHWAESACRIGGEPVKVSRQHPNGLTLAEYEELIACNSQARAWTWRDMQRNARVYVKGKITHPDHATVTLNGWHRVFMNTERRVEAVAFLD